MKNLFKHLSVIVFTLALCLIVPACSVIEDSEKQVNAPVFHGVDDVYVEKGTQFLPLEGVSVTDVEDGNINAASIQVDARSVNVNVVGDYTVVYTVYDADGNKTEVTRNVHVIYTDVVKPDLYGVADTEIVVGEDFSIMDKVSAIDNVDGDLTKDIKTTGSVDVWKLGEYEVTYKVEDSEGNMAEKVRKITVSEGNFAFKDSNALVFAQNKATISGGQIYSTIADFALLKLELKLSSEAGADLHVTVAGATGNTAAIKVGAEATYVLYFRFTAPLVNAEVALDADVEIVSAAYAFCVSADTKAPVIAGAPSVICVPFGATAAMIKAEMLRGVTAEDEIEGNVTSLLDVDLTGADLTATGNYKVKVVCADSQGNKSEEEVDLIIATARDTGIIQSPDFADADKVAAQFKVSSGAGGSTSGAVVDGEYVFTITTPGGWASGDSPYLSGLKTSALNAGNWYMFKMDVKAEVARKMIIRAGNELWTDPWIENFKPNQTFNITTEWTTIYYIFFVENATSTAGSDVVKFELQLGSIDWSEGANVVYFDNAQFYLLSNVSNAPEVTPVSGLPTKFGANCDIPDFTGYVTANDVEDGAITITNEMVDLTGVDFTKAGTYTVVIHVADSDQEVTDYEFTIEILAQADTVGPVIEISQTALTMLSSMMPLKEGYDLTSVLPTIFTYITITDDVDGSIVPAIEMVDFGTLNAKSANVGEHTVSISCKDASGNESNVVELVIKVKDGKAPTFIGVRDYTVYVGQEFNPMLGVQAYDSTDGIICLEAANLAGFADFMDASGKVTGAAGQYQVTYTVQDEAGNEATATAVITVEAEEPEYNEYGKMNLLTGKVAVAGATGTYDSDSVLTIEYNGPVGWYASAIQLKYYGVKLEAGTTYKFVLTAYAELPRDILVYFVDGDGNKIPGFTATSNKHKIGLMSQSYTYEYLFTPTTSSSINSILELEFDWESYLVNAGLANTIVIEELYIIPQGESVPPVEPAEQILKLDFEDGAGTGKYNNAAWTQYKYTTSWVTLTDNQMNSRSKVSKVVNFTGGNSTSYKYIYNEGGSSLGTATKMSFQLGNYFDPKTPFGFKVVLVSSDKQRYYVMGSADAFEQIAYKDSLVDYSFDIDKFEVTSIEFIIYSTHSGSQYAYIDNIVIEGQKPDDGLEELACIDFEDGTVGSSYTSSKWETGKLDTETEDLIPFQSPQMNCREKNGSKVVNIVAAYGQVRMFTYYFDEPINKVEKITMKLGNYFDNKADYSLAIMVLDASFKTTFLLGDYNNFGTIPAGDGMVDYSFDYEGSVYAITFINCGAGDNHYLYMDDICFRGVEEDLPIERDLEVLAALDFEDGSGNGEYNNAAWSQQKLVEGTWTNMSNAQMYSKTKNESKVVNIVAGWSQKRRFAYTFAEDVENVEMISMRLGNYASGASEYSYRIYVVDDEEQITYIAGDADNYVKFAVTTDLLDVEYNYEGTVHQIVFENYSSLSGNQYLYIDDITLWGFVESDPERTDVLVLDFEDAENGQNYANADWSSKYFGSAWTETSGAIKGVVADETSAAAFGTQWSCDFMHTYAPADGIGTCNGIEIDCMAYSADSTADLKVRIFAEDANGNRYYFFGDASSYEELPVGEQTALIYENLADDPVNFVKFFIQVKGSNHALVVDSITFYLLEE